MLMLMVAPNGFDILSYKFEIRGMHCNTCPDPFDPDENEFFELTRIPLPAALPLYGAGLVILGLAGWWRKRII